LMFSMGEKGAKYASSKEKDIEVQAQYASCA
jgi:hypothetical protein